MIYGYARVSSKSQLDGNGLEVQLNELTNEYANIQIYEEQYTGTKVFERPVLNELLSKLEAGDKLVATKLDRIARNTVEGIKIIEELFEKGVSVHILNIGLLENTTMGKFFLTVLLAVAEMERNTIMERTREGKEIAKQKEGYREGRKKTYSKEQLDHALSMLSVNGGMYSYSQVSNLLKISKSTLVRAQKEREIKRSPFE